MNEQQIPKFQWGSLSYLSSRVGRLGTLKLTEMMESEALTRNHFMIVCALQEFAPMSQNDLSLRTDLNRGHLVAYLDELAQHGIVERSVDPGDRRRNLITLTESGQKFTAKAMSAARDSEMELFGVLNVAQREQLRDLLQLVVAQEDESAQ